MASQSEYSVTDHERFQARTNYSYRDPSPPSGPRIRADSIDVRECGGRFRDIEYPHSYPPHLELSEEENTVRSAPSASEAGSSFFHQWTHPGGRPALSAAPSTPHTSNMARYLTSTPYLQPADLSELHRQRSGRRTSSRGTASSAHDTEQSDYLSARGYSPSSYTQNTQDENADEQRDLDGGSTPYFTPSQSPSRRTEETAEEQGAFEGRAPDSPDPRSNYYPNDGRYVQDAVESFEEHFHGDI